MLSQKLKVRHISKDGNVLAIIQSPDQFIKYAPSLEGFAFGFGNARQLYPASGKYPHQKPGSFQI